MSKGEVSGLKLTKFVLLVVLACLGLAACGSESTPTTQPTATTAATPTAAVAPTTAAPATTAASSLPTIATQDGLTMKTAYAAVEPMIMAWNPKAVLISVFTPPDSGVGMDSQGRASQWFFEALAPATWQHSTWLVKALPGGKNSAEKSIEDILPADLAQLMEDHKLPPINTLIDTDRLMQVARDNGGTKSDQPLGIRLESPPKEGDPLAFDLVFYNGDQVLRLRIDAQSGKLVENTKG